MNTYDSEKMNMADPAIVKLKNNVCREEGIKFKELSTLPDFPTKLSSLYGYSNPNSHFTCPVNTLIDIGSSLNRVPFLFYNSDNLVQKVNGSLDQISIYDYADNVFHQMSSRKFGANKSVDILDSLKDELVYENADKDNEKRTRHKRMNTRMIEGLSDYFNLTVDYFLPMNQKPDWLSLSNNNNPRPFGKKGVKIPRDLERSLIDLEKSASNLYNDLEIRNYESLPVYEASLIGLLAKEDSSLMKLVEKVWDYEEKRKGLFGD